MIPIAAKESKKKDSRTDFSFTLKWEKFFGTIFDEIFYILGEILLFLNNLTNFNYVVALT